VTVESIYAAHCAGNTAIASHLPRLRALATGLDVAVEFGVKRGASSSALLLGAGRVISYDIAATSEARELKRIAGERWDYRIGDSRTAEFDQADLLFIDSQHDAEQCRAELDAHADGVRRFLVAHDTITFGSVGADGESGLHKWQYARGQSCPADALGVRIAFDELMIRDPSWRIVAHYPDSHGLLVLERR
jgi:hypothetical protein